MSETRRRGIVALKIAAGIALLVALVIATRQLPVAESLREFQAYVRELGFAGYFLYVVVYALCCVLFIPASILTLGAGAIFGLYRGFAVVMAGAFLGAMSSFILARTALRHRLEKKIAANAKFRALDRAIAREGTRIVFLVRLSPLFGFTYVNYAFGLTGISVGGYAIATFFGMIPATFAFTYIGYLGEVAADAAVGERSSITLFVQIAGAVIALVVALFVARLARAAIQRAGVDELAGE